MSLKLITKYHPNGQKHFEGYYDETDPIGDQFSWYDNGNKEYESIELNELIKELENHPTNLDLINSIAIGYFENPSMLIDNDDLKHFFLLMIQI